MAKYRPSAIIHSISGSVGEVTFSSWKGVPIISKRIRKQRILNTLQQKKVKTIFSSISQDWKNLTFVEQAMWSAYAKMHKKIKTHRRSGLVTKMGNRMSGANAYISLNAVLMYCGFEPIKYPVLGNIKNPTTVLTDLHDPSEYKGEIRFRIWLPYNYIVKCVSQIWIQKMETSSYSYIAKIVPVSSEKTEVVIDKIRTKTKNNVIEKSLTDIGKCKLLLQMRIIAENGKYSMPSPIYRIQVLG